MKSVFTVWLSGVSCPCKEEVAKALDQTLTDLGFPPESLCYDSIVTEFPSVPDETKWSVISLTWITLLIKTLLKHNIPVVASFVAGGEIPRAYLQSDRHEFIEVAFLGEQAAAIPAYSRANPDIFVVPQNRRVEDVIAEIVCLLQDRDCLTPLPGGDYSAEDEEKIKQRLEQLGYL